MSKESSKPTRPDSERCGVCLAWPEEHNEWQWKHCEEIASRREWDKPLPPLRVRGGSLDDFKKACGAPTANYATVDHDYRSLLRWVTQNLTVDQIYAATAYVLENR